MRRYPLYTVFYFVFLSGFGQLFTMFDTLKIPEVEIAYRLPLNNNDKVNLYQQFQSSSIDEINAGLPGMSLISRGGYAFEPVLNGFSAGQINVTIDGMKMFGACTDKMDPVTSYVETINLESLEMDFGTSGNKYGSTIGGAFNMQLHKPVLFEDTLLLGSRYNSVSKGVETLFVLNSGGKAWGYRASGNFRKHNEYFDGNGKIVPFTQFKKINLQQSLLFQTKNDHQLIAQVLVDNAYDVGYAALPMDVALAKGRIYSLEFLSGKTYGHFYGITAKVYANTVYHLMDDSYRDSLYMVTNKHGQADSVYMKMDMPGWSNTYGAYLEGNRMLGMNHRLSVRIEDYVNVSRAEMTMFMNNLSHPGEPPMYTETWPEVSRHVSGIYLKNTTGLGGKHSIGLNGRYDHNVSKVLSLQGIQQFQILGYELAEKDIEKAITFNVDLLLNLGPKSKLKFGAGYGERVPTLSEKYGFYLFNAFDGYDYVGNPELENERSINVSQLYQFSGARFKLNFEQRANWVADYIFGEVSTEMQALNLYAAGLKQYMNIESAFLYAANLEAWYQINQHLEVNTMLKYNLGNKNDDEALPLIPPFKGVFAMVYNHKKLMVMLQNETSAKQNRIDVAYGELATPAYSLMHIKAGYRLKIGKRELKFNANCMNIFNTTYSEHLDWGGYYRAGRSVDFGLVLGF